MQITSTYFINWHGYPALVSCALLATVLGNSIAYAAPANPPVDAGLLQQQLSPARTRPPSVPREVQPLSEHDESASGSPAPKDTVRFMIKHFRLDQPLKVLDEAQLNVLLADFRNKENTAEDLKKAADKVTAFLQAKGYFFARTFIEQAQTENNVAVVRIVLGKLSGRSTGKPEILINAPNGKRLKDEVITNIIKSASTDPDGVRLNDIERGLLLINDVPGVAATGTFVRGQEPGSTALKINLREKSLWNFSVGTDNSGSRYTGAQRLTGGVRLNDPSGFGDMAQLDMGVTEGIQSVVAGYRIPVGSSGLSFNLGGNYLHYKVVTGLEGSDARGSARTLNAGLTYPVLRSRSANFYIGGAVNDKRLIDDINDTRFNERQIRSFNFNWAGNWLANKRNGIAYAGLMTVGNLNRDRVPNDAAQDQNTRKSQGRYLVVRNLARWEHVLNPSWSVAANYAFQFANKNLDTSEKLYLGGPRGVRAYSVEEAGGDQGHIVNLEARWRLPYASKAGETWTLLGFYDWGHTQLNRSTWTNWNAATPDLSNTYHLQGAGVGIRAQLTDRASLEFLAAKSIGNNPGAIAGKNADGLSHKYHLWINAALQF